MAHLAIVLGIRPDVIRASLVLNTLRAQRKHRITFIWSGQHYSDNLKDIFFREPGVAAPDLSNFWTDRSCGEDGLPVPMREQMLAIA